MTQKVHVVMSNDYPSAVFTNSEAADAYMEAKRAEKPLHYPPVEIHWCCYMFDLQDKFTPERVGSAGG